MSNNEKKTAHLQIKVTPTEKSLYQRVADRKNLELSSWIRFTLAEKAQELIAEMKDKGIRV